MKLKIVSFLLVFVLAFSCFAEDTATDQSAGFTVVSSPDVNVTIVEPSASLGTLVGTSVYSVSPVTPEDSTGLKAVLLEFLGSYDAIIVEHEYQDDNGQVIYVRDIQLDYVWICSCAFLALVIYCLFKAGGGLLCR